MSSTLLSTLATLEPESILECTASPWSEVETFCRSQDTPFSTLLPSQIPETTARADLAIVHDTLETTERVIGQQLLGYLRNSLARRIWVLVDPKADWELHDFISLGFRQDASLLPPDAQFRSYTYDIGSYNHRRSWNNSRFWANPQNFNKYRW